jgi:hypothetical protein
VADQRIDASIKLNREYELTLDLHNWWPGQEVTVGAVLEPSDAELLLEELRGPIGASVQFDLTGYWRRSGCIQAIGLFGIDVAGVGDGETGAVSLAELKQAIRTLKAGSTNVDVTGECGAFSLLSPVMPADRERYISCRRIRKSLECRYEGEVQPNFFGAESWPFRAGRSAYAGGVFWFAMYCLTISSGRRRRPRSRRATRAGFPSESSGGRDPAQR